MGLSGVRVGYFFQFGDRRRIFLKNRYELLKQEFQPGCLGFVLHVQSNIIIISILGLLHKHLTPVCLLSTCALVNASGQFHVTWLLSN